jgi:hypothetical protein
MIYLFQSDDAYLQLLAGALNSIARTITVNQLKRFTQTLIHVNREFSSAASLGGFEWSLLGSRASFPNLSQRTTPDPSGLV